LTLTALESGSFTVQVSCKVVTGLVVCINLWPALLVKSTPYIRGRPIVLSKSTVYARGINSCFVNQLPELEVHTVAFLSHPYGAGTLPTLAVQTVAF